MADSMPFNSVGRDRIYKAEDWAWYFGTFIGTGVFPKPETGLKVSADEGMKIAVQVGCAFINGYAFRNPRVFNQTLDMADGALARIDRIVVRWDLMKRDIYISVLKGTPSAVPTAQAITRNSEIYELVLGDVYVGKGVTEIISENITDQRLNSDLCGVVTGTVEAEGKLKEKIDEINQKIAGVAGKSVANNLATTAEGMVLDARQGKVLDDKKVDKISGKGLSTNDYTTDEKNKLAGLVKSALSSTSSITLTTRHDGTTAKDTITVPDNVKGGNFILAIVYCGTPSLSKIDYTKPHLMTLTAEGIPNSSPVTGTSQGISCVCLLNPTASLLNVSTRIIVTRTNLTIEEEAANIWTNISVNCRFIKL